MNRRFARFAAFLAGFAAIAGAHAQSDDLLLPVEKAFALTATAPTRDTVRLEWTIADGYYLYRSRIKTKAGAGTTLGTLDLPPGEPKHDEFLGDVEVFHHQATATQPFTLADPAADTVELSVQIQGCHELDPKICYPPATTKLSLKLPPPTAAASTPAVPAASGGSLKDALGGLGKPAAAPIEGMDAIGADAAVPGDEKLPLPPEQAFRFETIALGPTELLARWTMPKGYYLYRDKTVLTVPADAGVKLGALRWPAGKLHQDEHFGQVTVYFDQVELPISIARERGDAGKLRLSAEFQGCEDGGVCYPVMTRTVDFDLPAASAAEIKASAANAVAAPAAEQSE
ncbi:MAG TPA: protein-disulfide reductase DsbD N-terminal domain-containing protein, partial [Tahibacter sp.]|nr:protein-disulfide reductase DsbD N-terminal domain-containing protein [Tahibacter sp.]